MEIEPINEEILIAPKERNEQTSGGLFLPQTSETPRAAVGEVLATGDGVLLQDGRWVSPPVRPGDVVIYDSAAITAIKDENDRELHFVRINNLYGKVKV